MAMGTPRSGITENEQKQQLSVAYVHAVAARAGYACQLINIDDDSIDVQIAARGTVHQRAVLRSPKIDLQLKATARPDLKESHLSFALPIKNYNDLREVTLVPRLLVVLVLPDDDGQWLEQSEDQMISRRCAYWASLLGKPQESNTHSVTVHLSRQQQFTVASLELLMQRVSRREAI